MSNATSQGHPEPLSQRALRVLADVTSYLARGLESHAVLANVIGALDRDLGGIDARIWVRTPDGAAYQPIGPDEREQPDPISVEAAEPWFTGDGDGDGAVLRIPLIHEGERLGVIEAAVPDGAEHEVVTEVLGIGGYEK